MAARLISPPSKGDRRPLDSQVSAGTLTGGPAPRTRGGARVGGTPAPRPDSERNRIPRLQLKPVFTPLPRVVWVLETRGAGDEGCWRRGVLETRESLAEAKLHKSNSFSGERRGRGRTGSTRKAAAVEKDPYLQLSGGGKRSRTRGDRREPPINRESKDKRHPTKQGKEMRFSRRRDGFCCDTERVPARGKRRLHGTGDAHSCAPDY
ncbi:unnamed protein product [Boreogadus saida]